MKNQENLNNSQEKRQPTHNKPKMLQTLEFSDKDFKAATITMLQEARKRILGGKKKNS